MFTSEENSSDSDSIKSSPTGSVKDEPVEANSLKSPTGSKCESNASVAEESVKPKVIVGRSMPLLTDISNDSGYERSNGSVSSSNFPSLPVSIPLNALGKDFDVGNTNKILPSSSSSDSDNENTSSARFGRRSRSRRRTIRRNRENRRFKRKRNSQTTTRYSRFRCRSKSSTSGSSTTD